MHLDRYEPVEAPAVACEGCGALTDRVWLPGRANNVISDECDVVVKHGICNPDGTPRRYTSKAEMKKEGAKRGMENHVVHQPKKGTDKSPHTSRWV